MATFQPNPSPDPSELWIEDGAVGEVFRIWHVMFFCFSGLIVIVTLICCCMRFRVPRTKQEIEADYQRKKLANKFREKLRLIQNQDMESIDLKRALEIIQKDLCPEKKTDGQSGYTLLKNDSSGMRAEPQQIAGGTSHNKLPTHEVKNAK